MDQTVGFDLGLTKSPNFPGGILEISSDNRRVVSVGGYDRFNYGDLLFPLVLNSRLRRSEIMTHHATRGAEMQFSGGVDVLPIENLLRASTPLSVILGGGELLGAGWSQVAIYSASSPFDLPLIALYKTLPKRQFEALAKAAVRGTWPTPYVPSARSVSSGEIRLLGNAIGASSLRALLPPQREAVVEALKISEYLSVRDSEGAAILAKEGIAARLVPDSAAIIASLTRDLVVQPGESGVVFQCSRSWGHSIDGNLLESIEELSRRYGKVTLLPIGLAGGHSDQDALKKISRVFKRTPHSVKMAPVSTVNDVARVIKGAQVFVGSSLHGNITAMSMGLPSVGLDRISKLSHYLKTWGRGLTPFDVPASALIEAVQLAVAVSSTELSSRADELAAISLENTDALISAAYA